MLDRRSRTAGADVFQTELRWLWNNPDRHIRLLRASEGTARRQAASRIDDVVAGGDYDVVVIGVRGNDSRVGNTDDATQAIATDAGSVDLVTITNPDL